MRLLTLFLAVLLAAAPLSAAKSKSRAKAKPKDKVVTWLASGPQAPAIRFSTPKAKNAARELSYGRPGQAPAVLLSTLGSVVQAGWARNGETFAVLMKGRQGGTELFLFDREGRGLEHLTERLEQRRLAEGGACEGKREPWKALRWRGDQLDLRSDLCGRERWVSESMGASTVSEAPPAPKAKPKAKAKPKKKAKTKKSRTKG